jgi:hypothetical protein
MPDDSSIKIPPGLMKVEVFADSIGVWRRETWDVTVKYCPLIVYDVATMTKDEKAYQVERLVRIS